MERNFKIDSIVLERRSLLMRLPFGVCFCAFVFTMFSSQVWGDEISDADAPKVVAVRVATDSENEGYEAFKAFDGNPETFWHSMFSRAPFEYSAIQISCGYGCGCVDQHPKRKISRAYDPSRPFELRVDLGDEFELKGFRYRPRVDENCNGQVGDYDVFVLSELGVSEENSDVKKELIASSFDSNGIWLGSLGTPIVSGTFSGSADEMQNGALVEFPKPVKGRYVVFRAKNELRGQPYSSVAELELLSDGTIFRASRSNEFNVSFVERSYLSPINDEEAFVTIDALLGGSQDTIELLKESPYFQDLLFQYNRLIYELKRPDYYDAIKSQLPNEQTGILLSDRDPADVVLRRTQALWLELNDLDENYFTQDDWGSDSDESLKDDLSLWRKLVEKNAKTSVDDVDCRFQLYLATSMWRRILMFQHSELDFDRLLFVKRNRANYNHLCDQFYGRAAVPGGGLYTLSSPFADLSVGKLDDATRKTLFSDLQNVVSRIGGKQGASAGNLRDLLYRPTTQNILENSVVSNDSRLKGKKLEGGAFIAPELSFDGKQIAFAYCECEGSAAHISTLDLTRGHTQEGRCYHLFKCAVDGSNLQMISDGTWNDFDPCFLPNGRLVFISERRNGYLRCGRDCPTYTLFDMNPDGSKIRCLSRHETNEWAPSVANDGQILWTRWDYIDRFGCIAHGAWTTTPDGRNPRAVCGNFAPRHLRPDSVMDIRAIPNSSKLIATAGPHHGQSFGSIVKIDPNAPDDPSSPITRMTPEVGFPESQDGAQVWGTPYPLSEDLFLAVADYSFDRNAGREGGKYTLGNYGIFLVDAYGNRELLYRDFEIGSSTPIPLVARETPPVVPSLIPESEIKDEPFVTPQPFDGERPQGVVSIQNVYASEQPLPEGVKIKSIRVIQVFCMSMPSGAPPYEIGVREATSTDSVKLARRVWGVAPVEEDGSACFYVPAECEIYFQALDEDGLVVQSMRSGTALRPNENLSCVGCHEPKNAAGLDSVNVPVASQNVNSDNGGKQIPLALRREPSKLEPEGVGTQPINFPELVQPILDEHCVECHNEPESQEEGAPSLEREPYKHGFYASYWNIMSRGLAFNDYGSSLVTTPGKFGARASVLYSMLQDHYDVELSDSERRRIALWLDTNTLFFGVYEKEGCEKELRGERALPTLE